MVLWIQLKTEVRNWRHFFMNGGYFYCHGLCSEDHSFSRALVCRSQELAWTCCSNWLTFREVLCWYLVQTDWLGHCFLLVLVACLTPNPSGPIRTCRLHFRETAPTCRTSRSAYHWPWCQHAAGLRSSCAGSLCAATPPSALLTLASLSCCRARRLFRLWWLRSSSFQFW